MNLSAFDATLEALIESPRLATASKLVHHLVQLAGLGLKTLQTGRTSAQRPWAYAVADRPRWVFSRWYIRCQCEQLATLDTVATVVGQAVPIRPNVLILAVTGKLTEDAWTYVTDINRESTLRYVCLDIDDLQGIGIDHSRLDSIIARRSSPDFIGS